MHLVVWSHLESARPTLTTLERPAGVLWKHPRKLVKGALKVRLKVLFGHLGRTVGSIPASLQCPVEPGR